ncbi:MULTISPECIES: hypothetical protein [unclassified Breznakia]|uniref:hypothetical protein n=1 Tax=unclassified Breznakia TaxID=2623764 RepID=UPI00247701A3|nr:MULTISPECIES: hypothetical protein [unclassified Breznakia]MDH6367555.1 hypothetical protein [Breznakia sp. PH1-1]MDH6404651.1 hypothetical protein [Breznakia sp. PF1-11]MDH6412385.1 hypothetical protein [Breznakia sp. PFB1-11]MDH6414723.1 hypothetical protein [Breznakia sp. PFB1-14]MDH6417032.1 hypothetical protein [Breznakia sp. PFB1-4]
MAVAKVKLKLFPSKLKQLDLDGQKALAMTGEELNTRVRNAQVMPFDTGSMQNEQTFVDDAKKANGQVTIITTSPQARRLYFHPEYDFQTINNPNAKGNWYEDWLPGGTKQKDAAKLFGQFYKRLIG